VTPRATNVRSDRAPSSCAPTGGLRTAPTGIIVLLVTVAAFVGVLPATGYSPLLVVAGVASLVICLALWRRPSLMLNVLVFAMLLPEGLLPGTANSLLVLLLMFFNVARRLVALPRSRPAAPVLLPVVLLAAFGIWALLSITWSGDATTSRSALVQFVLVAVLFVLLVSEVRDLRSLDAFMNTLALVGWFLIACSAFTLLAHGYSSGQRFAVFDQNPNVLGVVLILALPGVFWRSSKARPSARAGRRVQFAIYLAASGGLIALTESRGSLIALVILTGVYLCHQATRAAGFATLAGGLIVVFVVPVLLTSAVARFGAPADPGTYELSRSTLSSAGWELFSDRPLLGGGIGYGPYLMKPYVDERVGLDYFKTRSDYPAHNPLIEVADDTGVPGLVLYVGVVLSAMGLFGRQLWRALRAASPAKRSRFRRTAADTERSEPQAPEVGEAKLALNYLAPVAATSVAVFSTVIKGGGVWDATTTFVLLALLVIPVRLRLTGPPKEVAAQGEPIGGQGRPTGP
jgi:putative inorganic carbon (hco3(-)) transporter